MDSLQFTPAQSNELIIVAVVYLEKSYQQTLNCINATGLPVYYVQRKPPGVGSLAEAINRGFREAGAIRYKYTWFVTNITFAPSAPLDLMKVLKPGERYRVAAAHPVFDSDHEHLRPSPIGLGSYVAAPFIEFTAAMVNSEIFAANPLDERMPYWGHDLDWGYQINQQGKNLLVAQNVMVSHTYIRNIQKPESWTIARKQARKATDKSTTAALIKKWGADWKGVLWPKSPETIGRFYSDVAKKLTSQNF